MVIAPHGSAVVIYKLHVLRPGPFESTRTIYLDDGGLREVKVSVRGEAIEAETKTNDKP